MSKNSSDTEGRRRWVVCCGKRRGDRDLGAWSDHVPICDGARAGVRGFGGEAAQPVGVLPGTACHIECRMGGAQVGAGAWAGESADTCGRQRVLFSLAGRLTSKKRVGG